MEKGDSSTPGPRLVEETRRAKKARESCAGFATVASSSVIAEDSPFSRM